MTDESRVGATHLPPDEAFSALGNETRLRILRTLGEAQGPLSFTDLRDRVGIEQGRQFNYHLEKLVGHFLRKVEDGYRLRAAGERVVEAVLSGAVTDSPVLERTRIDWTCWYCGAPSIEVSYLEEMVGFYCPECGGNYDRSYEPQLPTDPPGQDRLGYLPFPPAGVKDREPRAVLEAALTWYLSEIESNAAGLCPRCSAPTTKDLTVCEDHDTGDGFCDRCGRRYAVQIGIRCTNCLHELEVVLGLYLLTAPRMRAFLIEHGFDPVSPSFERLFGTIGAFEEVVHSTDPFEATFTFAIDDDELTLAVDENLDIAEVTDTD